MIQPNDLPRKNKAKVFLQEFLGTTKNASNCYIENMDGVLTFKRYRTGRRLASGKKLALQSKFHDFTVVVHP